MEIDYKELRKAYKAKLEVEKRQLWKTKKRGKK